MAKTFDKKQRSTLKKVLTYVRKYWLYLILSVLTSAVTVVLTLLIPIIIGDAIDYIIDIGRVDFEYVAKRLFQIFMIVCFTALSQWIMNISNNKITYEVVRDIRTQAFDKIQILPLKYLDGRSYGEIVSRVISDVDQFAEGLLVGFTQFFTGVLTILGTLIFMLVNNVGITLVVVCITPLSLFVAGFIAKNTYHMFQLQSEARGEQTSLID